MTVLDKDEQQLLDTLARGALSWPDTQALAGLLAAGLIERNKDGTYGLSDKGREHRAAAKSTAGS